MEPVIEGVDHVYIPVLGAVAAFEVLTGPLALPIAWPFADSGGFASGGVSLGNVNLEILESSTLTPSFTAAPAARVRGVALRPTRHLDPKFFEELKGRSITYLPPMPGPAWTNVLLPGLLGADSAVFICDYHDADYSQATTTGDDVATDRHEPLEIVTVSEIVVGARDVAAAARSWQSLLSPGRRNSAGAWQLATGPAIRLTADGDDCITALTIKVRSPEKAKSEWHRHVAPTSLRDLPILFVE